MKKLCLLLALVMVFLCGCNAEVICRQGVRTFGVISFR